MPFCRDVIALLTEYLEGGLTRARTRSLEAHLKLCDPCVGFLETLKKTSAAVSGLRVADIPPDCRRQLRDFLKRQARPSTPARAAGRPAARPSRPPRRRS
jgi:anti-sigma factor RsiW